MEKNVRIRLYELLKFLTHIKNVYLKLAVLPYILVCLAMNALFQFKMSFHIFIARVKSE